jgi:hypothetical protein
MKNQLQEMLAKNLAKKIDWPKQINLLTAEDVSRNYPIRQGNKKCLTGHATDLFLYGKGSALAYDTFRIAFQLAAMDFKDEKGFPYFQMGPFNDDGRQTEEQIASVFNEACMMLGYDGGGKKAA